MNRRDCLKSMLAAAGSALVPSWLVPGRPSHGIDLSAFCSPAWIERKYQMKVPFVQQGIVDVPIPDDMTRYRAGDGVRWEYFRYATDARVCVRVPINTGDLIDREKTDLPPACSLGWTHDLPYRGKWVPWPKANYILAASSDCPACQGTGDASGDPQDECETCYGTGHEWVGGAYDMSHPITCRTCKGLGFVPTALCGNCEGHAIGTFPAIQRLPTHYIDARYHGKIARLPGAEYFIPERPAEVITPIKIRFAGGQGLLMPLEPKPTEERIRGAK